MADNPYLLLAAAILAGLIAWTALLGLARLLPGNFLVARMREQPAGSTPVRQIGGLVIAPVYLAGLAVTAYWQPQDAAFLSALGAAGLLLWIVGIADDHKHLPVSLRLTVQLLCAGAVAFAFDPALSVSHGAVAWWIERCLLAAGIVYFINMTNFMDGMDLMSVAGLGIPLLACLFLCIDGIGGSPISLATTMLAGALAGFAAFNRPPALLYLGDNGALVLGLAAGTMAVHLAFEAELAAALLPFGYYLVDSTTTLALRMLRGENLFEAHSCHAYQMARRAGRSHGWIVMHVLATNTVLAILAAIAANSHGPAPALVSLFLGIALSAGVVLRFRGWPAASQSKEIRSATRLS